MSTITAEFSSSKFDIVVSGLVAISWLGGWGPSVGIAASLWRGAQAFCAVNLADRSLRWICLGKVEKKAEPLASGVINGLIEEGMYSVVLRTESSAGILAGLGRFAFALLGAKTASRAFAEPTTNEAQKKAREAKDSLAGLGWAAIREAMLFTLPPSYSLPILVTADSLVFGLSEVCPKSGGAHLPKYTAAWFYKASSGTAFRLVANISTIYAGPVSAVAQHVLFNISRALPE